MPFRSQDISGQEFPAPNADMIAIFLTPCLSIAARVFFSTSRKKNGAAVGFPNGDSDVRGMAKVVITALINLVQETKAASMSASFIGVPLTTVTLEGSGLVKVDGFRTRAVTVWPLLKAEAIASWPVRPEAPRMRICIVLQRRSLNTDTGSGCEMALYRTYGRLYIYLRNGIFLRIAVCVVLELLA